MKKLSRERIRAEIFKMLASSKKQNLLAVLKVFQNKKIAAEIFSSNLDIKALAHLFEIEEKFKISADLNLKVAVLFGAKNLDHKKFFTEICATNLEKKYFQFIAKNSVKDLKKLLVENDKEMVLGLYLQDLSKNYDLKKIAAAKKTISYLRKFSLPDFPLKSSDLIALGFSGKKLGLALQKTQEIWAENDFKFSKNELIASLKQ